MNNYYTASLVASFLLFVAISIAIITGGISGSLLAPLAMSFLFGYFLYSRKKTFEKDWYKRASFWLSQFFILFFLCSIGYFLVAPLIR